MISLGGITKQQRGDYDDYGAMDPGMPMGMNMGMNMPLAPGRGGFMRGRGGFWGRPAPYPPMRGRGEKRGGGSHCRRTAAPQDAQGLWSAPRHRNADRP